MLSLAPVKAKQMGIKKVLITCDKDNIASAKVIESNGGKLENIIENIIVGGQHKKILDRNIKR